MKPHFYRFFTSFVALFFGVCAYGDTGLPDRLAGLVLGEHPDPGYLAWQLPNQNVQTSSIYIVATTSSVAERIGKGMLPKSHVKSASAELVLYKGRLVEIVFFLPNESFVGVQKALTNKFGKAAHKATLVSDVSDGCAPYIFQAWQDVKRSLYLTATNQKKKGVGLILRDNRMNELLAYDDSDHLDYDRCIQF